MLRCCVGPQSPLMEWSGRAPAPQASDAGEGRVSNGMRIMTPDCWANRIESTGRYLGIAGADALAIAGQLAVGYDRAERGRTALPIPGHRSLDIRCRPRLRIAR